MLLLIVISMYDMYKTCKEEQRSCVVTCHAMPTVDSFEWCRNFSSAMRMNVDTLQAKFFSGNENIFCIPPQWHDTESRNPSSSKTKTYLFYIVNVMGADVLATPGTIIFTLLNRINSVPARLRLINVDEREIEDTGINGKSSSSDCDATSFKHVMSLNPMNSLDRKQVHAYNFICL